MVDGNRFVRGLARLLSRCRSALTGAREMPSTVRPSPGSAVASPCLAGRTVLVTGGAGNVGRGIATEFAKQGSNIVIVDLDANARESLERELAEYPGWVKGYDCDLSRVDAIDRLCETLQGDSVRVDVLINNLGVQFKTRSVVELDIAEWQQTFATNVFGPMHLTRCVARSMIDNRCQGSIIFITSIHQWVVRRYASYSASKGALGMIVKELAVDLAPHGVRVNGIAPGWVAEDGAGRPLAQRVAPLHQSSIPPCFIGRAAVFLSEDYYSLHTTGSVLKVDAGLSLANYLV